MLKINGKMYKKEKIRTSTVDGVAIYKLFFFDFAKMGGVGLNGYSFDNRKKTPLSKIRASADFVFNLNGMKNISVTDEYFMEKFMDEKTILKAIKRVKLEKKVSQKDKDFLVGWLSDGLDGPDQLLKEEISTRDWEWTADDQLNADICEATDGMSCLSHVGG